MPLLDAETFHLHACPAGPERCHRCAAMAHPPAEWAPRLFWAGPTAQDPDRPRSFDEHVAARHVATLGVALDVVAALAIVNDGRWIVCCPDPDCTDAQVASRNDRRFFCITCCNREAGGHWRPVVWPDDNDLTDTERILEQRPDVGKRQWWPSDGKGEPHPLLKRLLQEGRLRQFSLPVWAPPADYLTPNDPQRDPPQVSD